MTQKFHGIQLAANSYLENASFERLAATPSQLTHGRVWYNTVDNTFNYSALNAEGAVVVHTFATAGDLVSAVTTLTTNINNEAARAQAAEAQLTTDLAAEVTRATSAESALSGRVLAVETSYINKDGTVAFTADQSMQSHKLINVGLPTDNGDAANKAYVDSRISALGNAFEYVGSVEGGDSAANAFDLATLTKKQAGAYYKVATSGQFKLGTGAAFQVNAGDGIVFNVDGGVDKIDNTNSQVQGVVNFTTVTGNSDTGFTVDLDQAFKDRVSSLESGLTAETARAQAAEAQLTTDLLAEISRAQAAETANSGALATEVARAQAAEAQLTTDLAAEVTRATGAEATLAAAVAAEETRAKAAELQLTTDLAAEQVRASSAEAGLQTQVNDLRVQARMDTTGLAYQINAGRFTFLSETASLTHTVNHFLGSDFLTISLMIKGSDGVWRNDIAPIEEVSNNTFVVTLSEAAFIKVSGQANDTINFESNIVNPFSGGASGGGGVAPA